MVPPLRGGSPVSHTSGLTWRPTPRGGWGSGLAKESAATPGQPSQRGRPSKRSPAAAVATAAAAGGRSRGSDSFDDDDTCAWQECKNRDGRTYYFNASLGWSGKSVWLEPKEHRRVRLRRQRMERALQTAAGHAPVAPEVLRLRRILQRQLVGEASFLTPMKDKQRLGVSFRVFSDALRHSGIAMEPAECRRPVAAPSRAPSHAPSPRAPLTHASRPPRVLIGRVSRRVQALPAQQTRRRRALPTRRLPAPRPPSPPARPRLFKALDTAGTKMLDMRHLRSQLFPREHGWEDTPRHSCLMARSGGRGVDGAAAPRAGFRSAPSRRASPSPGPGARGVEGSGHRTRELGADGDSRSRGRGRGRGRGRIGEHNRGANSRQSADVPARRANAWPSAGAGGEREDRGAAQPSRGRGRPPAEAGDDADGFVITRPPWAGARGRGRGAARKAAAAAAAEGRRNDHGVRAALKRAMAIAARTGEGPQAHWVVDNKLKACQDGAYKQ